MSKEQLDGEHAEQILSDSQIFVDKHGQPLRMCISRSAYGGTVTNDERTAFILLAAPGQSYTETMYSTEWVDHCIEQLKLIDHDTPMYKLKLAKRADKTLYTLEDDRLLRKFIEEKKRNGAKIKGNLIYQDFAAENQQHTYQSWRDRAIKVLKLTDDAPLYVASKVRREEQLKRLPEKSGAQQIEDRTVDAQQQEIEVKQPTTTTQPQQALESTDGFEQGNSPVIELDLEGESETPEYQTQPATQNGPFSPLILDFSDINSDEEEDRIHKQEMDALALRRSNPNASQTIRTLGNLKLGSTDIVAGKGANEDSLELGQPKGNTRTLAGRPNLGRRLSLSPPRKSQTVETSHHTKARNSRLSLPNMNKTDQTLISSEHRKEPYTAKSSNRILDTGNDSDSSQPEVSSTIEQQSGRSQHLISPTPISWRNPPQSDLSMPNSLSLRAPTVNTEVDIGEIDQSLRATVDSAETGQLELTDEDDIAIEKMVLEKMERSNLSSVERGIGQSMDLDARDILESDIQNPSSEQLLADENQASGGSSGELLDNRQDEVASLKEQEGDGPGSFHDFVLPAKLLTGRASGVSQRPSRDVERAVGVSQTEEPSLNRRASLIDSVSTRVENAEVFDEGEQAELSSSSNDERDEARSAVLLKPHRQTKGRSALNDSQHYDSNLSESRSKSASIKYLDTKENRKSNSSDGTVRHAHEQNMSKGNGNKSIRGTSSRDNDLGADRGTTQSMKANPDHAALPDRHKRRLSTEDDEEEETLIRRKRNTQPLQPVQRNDSLVNVHRTTKEASTGHISELDAVQEYYGNGLGNNSHSQGVNEAEEDRISRERLLLYLRDLYRAEIRTLVMYELVPPLKAIDILDACSGNLKLARAFANDGITENIQSQFWTRQDDSKVFSKKKGDEIDLVRKHSLVEIFQRYQYLTKTRADAGQFKVSPGALQASGLLKRRMQDTKSSQGLT
ncbi:hypothetical protein BGX26_008296 [Mortierella sp. AD094]|nr:hypothetical protein BGX26_008296 [Mortierella sp. AD094]